MLKEVEIMYRNAINISISWNWNSWENLTVYSERNADVSRTQRPFHVINVIFGSS